MAVESSFSLMWYQGVNSTIQSHVVYAAVLSATNALAHCLLERIHSPRPRRETCTRGWSTARLYVRNLFAVSLRRLPTTTFRSHLVSNSVDTTVQAARSVDDVDHLGRSMMRCTI